MPVQAAESRIYQSQSLLELLQHQHFLGKASLVTVITVCPRNASFYFYIDGQLAALLHVYYSTLQEIMSYTGIA